MAFYVVSAGQTSSGLTLQPGDVMQVYSGGSAVQIDIAGGEEVVFAGGVASANTISAGGTLALLGGAAVGTVIDSGGQELLEGFGGPSIDTVVNAGGSEIAQQGTVVGSVIESGGALLLSAGTTASAATVSSGGVVVALPGATLAGTTVAPGGTVQSTGVALFLGGALIADAATLAGGTIGAPGMPGAAYVLSGGRALNTSVVSDSVQTVFAGGLTSDTTIQGGSEIVLSGAIASATTIGAGPGYGADYMLVSAGGSAVSAVIDGGILLAQGGSVRGDIVSGGIEEVTYGGVAVSTTVLDGTQTVGNDGIASGTILSGATQQVVSGNGGVASATLIGSGATQDIAFALAEAAVVQGGGLQSVAESGVASGTLVESGGIETVSDLAQTVDTVLSAGGYEVVSRGLASATQVGAGATENLVYGSGYGTEVQSGGAVLVHAYATASGTHLASGATLVVLPHGSASATTAAAGAQVLSSGVALFSGAALLSAAPVAVVGGSIGSGGTEYVLNGGQASALTMLAGGTQFVFSGGTASGTTISGSATQYIYSGGVVSAALLHGGSQTDMGSAIGTMLLGGAVQQIGDNRLPNDGVGFAETTLVGSGATQDVAGGTALNTTVSGGQQEIGVGTASGTVVEAGGSQLIDVYGTAIATTVLAAGAQRVAGGTAIGTVASSGGSILVTGAGTTSNTVLAGGRETVGYGTAIGTTIGAGGVEVVSGGTATGTIVQSGGTLVVLAGASVTGTTVQAGGTVTSTGVYLFSGSALISSGPTLTNQIVGGTEREYVNSGVASSTTITSGGGQLVSSGGIAIATSVFDFGSAYIFAGAVASNVFVGSEGRFELFSGTASGGTVVNLGFEEVAGGVAIGVAVDSGGQLYLGHGVTSAVVVSGGSQFAAGGIAQASVIEAGGVQGLDGSAVASATVVASGGTQALSYSATAIGTTIERGGDATVYRAQASGFLIEAGGYLLLSSGGIAQATQVSSGGTLVVLPGGSASASTVAAGGAVVSTGLVRLAGTTLISAGSATAGGDVIGAGGTEYVLADGAEIGATVNSGGVILVYSGGTVSGAYLTDTVSSYNVTEAVSSGGRDVGTTVGDGAYQIISSGAQAASTLIVSGQQAVGGVASAAIVGNGGSQTVEFSGIAYATTIESGGVQAVGYGDASGTLIEAGGMQNDFGSSFAATVFSGGYQVVSRLSLDTTIESGGVVDVGAQYGATASATVINGGGFENVEAGGSDYASVISAGGVQELEQGAYGDGAPPGGARADGTVILSGGEQIIDNAYGEYVSPASSTDINLSAGGVVNLLFTPYLSGESVDFNYTTDVLSFQSSAPLQFAGDYTGEYFTLASNGSGGTVVSLAEGTPCYCRGTRILTAAGEVAVEQLRIGDQLITKSGEARSLRWIGCRSYAGRFAANNRDVLPVLFRINSLGGGLPRGDLYVSPLHAMYIDGMLIPASCLVNGETVVQVRSVDRVDYFHLELDSHDVIIAEGALSESYIDDDNRGMFHNAAEYAALYPDAPRAAPAYCAPRVEDGDALQDARRRLHGAPPPASAPLRGSLDLVERHRVAGWAMSDDGAPVRLRIVDNGAVISEVLADLPRPDVRATVGGDGRCGFSHVIEGGLAPGVPHLIQVQRASDAQDLPRSPWLLEMAACVTPAEPAALRGCLDEADRIQVQGWAQAGADPVDLQILDNGVPVGRVLANRFRADLAESDHGDGRCAFAYRFPTPLSPALRHVIDVRRASDGAPLENSPLRIEAADAFDGALEQAVAQAVASLTDQDRDRVLSFLQTQTDRLQQRSADAQAQRAERDDFRQFRRRWGAANTGRAAPPKRALIIDRDLPRPDRDAGSQAILSHMRALQRAGYAVSFVAAEQMTHAASQLAGTDIAVCAAPIYTSVEDVLRRQSGCVDLIYLHRAEIAQSYMALARRWMPKARIVYAVADLHHLRLARQAEIEQRPELHAQSRRLRLAECTAAWSADAVITHSPHEAALLRQAVPHADIHVVPWDVPLRPVKVPFAKRHGLAFIANYAHAPNIDAARWLVEDIMPLVWAQDASIECQLAGSAMAPAIRVLAGPRVTLLGYVPDLATLFKTVRLTVAPLRFGAGIKGKVLDSLAAGIPCAATPIAAEGLDLPPGLIAADPAALAALILRLHGKAAANRTAARAGRALIERDFQMAQVDAALNNVIGAALRRVAIPSRA